MMVLDSLGMLSTTKEIEDSTEGKETRDMTRAQVVKSVFRILSLKLGQAQIPLIVTNHTYDVVGAYVPTKEMGGGTGLKYAASTIVYLSKSKEKDGKVQVGNIIKCRAHKSRFTKENSQVETRLFYDERGLDKYYGLLELGEKHGIFTKVAGRYDINGTKFYAKQILADPERFFTEEVMQELDKAANSEYSYGGAGDDDETEEVEE
jgi:RecA/RadA recombinase